MSATVVDAWLDGELDAGELPQLETWLREDPAHARDLLHAAALQEDLRAAYRQRAAVLPVPARSAVGELWHWLRPSVWMPVGGVAAALLLCALLYLQQHGPQPKPVQVASRPTPVHPVNPFEKPPTYEQGQFVDKPADKEGITVISGDLATKTGRKELSPSEQNSGWTYQQSVTEVQAGDTGGSLRWGADLNLQVNPRSSLRLVAFAGTDRRPGSRRVVQLDSGQVRVRRLTERPQRPVDPTGEPMFAPVEVVTAAGRIVADNAEFEVGYATAHAPFGKTTAVRVAVVSGQVRVPSGPEEKTLRAGETVNLPVPARK